MNNEKNNSKWDRQDLQQQQRTNTGATNVNIIQKIILLAIIGLMTSFGVVHADYEELMPETTVPAAYIAPQGDEIEVVVNSAAFPTFYFSAPDTGVVAGNGYADEDIMRYNSGTGAWTKAFDGTNNGLPVSADIDALALIINSGYVSYLMSFDTPTAVPGLGTADDSDVVRFDTWNGAWSMYLIGSTVGLTTDAEDIDGLTFSPGNSLVVSTRGGHTVNNFEGGTLKGNNKDLILLVDKTTGTWTKWFKGSQVGMQSTNNVNAVAFVRYNEAIIKDGRYIVGTKPWSMPNGTAVGANDVSEQLWFQNGGMDYYKRLDNDTIGFPVIDALEVVK